MSKASALVVLLLIGLGIGACRRAASPDGWPTQPVRLLVPFSAGSGVDLAARVFASHLAESWHQPVVVDNRPGPDGIAGTQAFVSATDEHTLLFSPAGPVTFASHLHERLPYDPVADIVPISSVGAVTLAIAVASSVEAASLADLARLIRHHPGKYLWTAASPGGPELVIKAFVASENLEMKQVSYRETSMALQDVGAGRVHVLLGSLPTIATLVRAGSVRLLAVTNTSRSDAIADIPTVSEAGYPALTLDGLWGLFGWKGMPETLRRRLAADLTRAATDRALVERLAVIGLAVRGGTPEEFAAAVSRQRQQAATLARLAEPAHD